MSAVRKIFMGLGILFVLLIIAGILFSGPLVKYGLQNALASLRESRGIDVTFSDASVSLGGGVSLDNLAAVDLNTKTNFADIKQINAQIGLSSLFSDPIVVEELQIQDPILTYFPGFRDMFSSPKTAFIRNGVAVETPIAEPADPEESIKPETSSRGVLIRKGQVRNGSIRYQPEGGEPQVILAGLDASVQDLSQTKPFSFDLEAELSGESKGILGLKGTVDPTAFDTDITFLLKGFEIPKGESKWPKTDGNVTLVLQNNMSKILSTGKVNMAAPPPSLPADLAAGGAFELNWKVDSNIENKGAGRIDLRSFDVAVHGLKGGPQALTGSGSYDPTTYQGNFQVVGKEISAPLLNTFLEPSLQMRLLAGKANVDIKAARSGADQPFGIDANLNLGGLNMDDLSGTRPNLKFKDISLVTKSTYSPEKDDLRIENLTAALDDIRLAVAGEIKGLQDSARRELDLVVQNDNLDLGRIIPLAAPDFRKTTGNLTGHAGINISIKGQTASSKFPVLNGNLDLKGVTFEPKDDPAKKIFAKGPVTFTSEEVNGNDLDVKLGDIPGKITFKVAGYNEPRKNINLNLKGLAIEPLVNLYKPEASGLLLGNLSGDVAMTLTEKNTPEGLVINYNIDKGMMLTRHPIPQAIVGLVGWEWLKNGFALTTAKGRIVQDEKGYRLDPLLFMGEKGGFALKGWVGFDNKLTATARLNVAKSAIDEIPKAIRPMLQSKEEAKFAFLDIPMGGTVSRPIPKLDMKSAVEAGVNILQDKFKDKLQGKLGDKVPLGNEAAGNVLKGVGEVLQGGSPAEALQKTQPSDILEGVGGLLKKKPRSKTPAVPAEAEVKSATVEQDQPAEPAPEKQPRRKKDTIEDVGNLLQGFLKDK